MDRSFENIFEKYNITYKIPRKRHKSIKTLTPTPLYKKEENLSPRTVSNTMKIQNINSCYLNTSSKGKYFIPTRYKTLEVFKVESIPKRISCPITENKNISFCGGDNSSKENCAKQISPWCGHKFGGKTVERDLSISIIELGDNSGKGAGGFNNRNNSLSNCFNISNSKQSYKKQEHNLSISTSFEILTNLTCKTSIFSDNFIDQTFQPSLNICDNPSETEDNTSITKPLVQNTNTELDLLIDLIVREEKKDKQQQEKCLNASLPAKNSCVKGGCQEIFERALRRETVKGNFLKYDRKMGLRAGKLLTAVEIVTSYGLTMAIVKSDDLNKNFAIVLAPQMVSRLKLGSQIEAFFDDKTLPYKLTLNGECLDIYLEPYKLLIV